MSYIKLTHTSGNIHLQRTAQLPDESVIFCTYVDTYTTYGSASFNLCVIVTDGNNFDLAYLVLRPSMVFLYLPSRTVKKINDRPTGITWYVENIPSGVSSFFSSWNTNYSQAGYLNVRYSTGTYGYYKFSKFQFSTFSDSYNIKDS